MLAHVLGNYRSKQAPHNVEYNLMKLMAKKAYKCFEKGHRICPQIEPTNINHIIWNVSRGVELSVQ